MATVELRDNEWKEFAKAEYAVIDCYGDFCSACVILEPVFDGVADELEGVSFGRINISAYSEIAEVYHISAMPTVLFFRKGELVHQSVGSIEREDLLALMATLLYQ